MRNLTLADTLMIVVALAVAPACSGCGGGGSLQTGPTTASAGLNGVIRNPSTATVSNLTPIEENYQSQLSASQSDVAANAGFAISNAALQAAQLEGLTNPFTGGALVGADVAGQSGAFSRVAPAMVIWNAPSLISSGKTATLSPLDLLPSPTTQLVGHTGSIGTEQTQLRNIDAQLALVEQSINVVLADPKFVYIVADPTQPNNPNATVELGSAEFEVLQAAVSIVRAVINASVAYDLDPGPYNLNDPISSVLAAQYATDATSIAPVSEFVPPSPFGTLEPDGAGRVKAVQTQLEAAASAAETAISNVEARNDNGYLINPGTVVSNSRLSEYRSEIVSYSTILTQEQTVSGFSGGPMVVDLPEFFNNPPQDLKVFMPSLTVIPNGTASGEEVTLRVTAPNYPDLTFGGLLPDNTNARIWHYTSHQGDQTTEAQFIEYELQTTP